MKAAVKVNNAAPWQYPAKTSRRTPPKDCNICEDHIIGLELNLNSRRLGGGLQKIVVDTWKRAVSFIVHEFMCKKLYIM